MLILARKPGEKIAIGDDITVTLLDIKGGQVRLGIEAPKDVGVHRSEVYERIRSENLAASRVDASDLQEAASLFQTDGTGGKRLES